MMIIPTVQSIPEHIKARGGDTIIRHRCALAGYVETTRAEIDDANSYKPVVSGGWVIASNI